MRFIAQVERSKLPRPVPGALAPETENRLAKDPVFHKDWQAYATAVAKAYTDSMFRQDINPAVQTFEQMRIAYYDQEGAKREKAIKVFNAALAKYQAHLRRDVRKESSRASFESFFNEFNPFYVAVPLYVLAFIFTGVAWLAKPNLD